MRNFFSKMALAIMSLNAALLVADSEPFVSVHKIPPVPYYMEDGYIISNLVSTNSAAIILDIGSKDGAVSRGKGYT